MIKYVILLYFYVTLFQKYKKHKNTKLNKIKKNPAGHLYHEILNYK